MTTCEGAGRCGTRGSAEVEAKHLPRLLWARLKLGKDGIELIESQFRAALSIKAAFDAGLLRYVLFLAQKD